jgi:hypothetical protein
MYIFKWGWMALLSWSISLGKTTTTTTKPERVARKHSPNSVECARPSNVGQADDTYDNGDKARPSDDGTSSDMAAVDEQRHNIPWEQDVEHDDERDIVGRAGRDMEHDNGRDIVERAEQDVRRRAQQSLQGKGVRTVQEVGVVRVEVVKVALQQSVEEEEQHAEAGLQPCGTEKRPLRRALDLFEHPLLV